MKQRAMNLMIFVTPSFIFFCHIITFPQFHFYFNFFFLFLVLITSLKSGLFLAYEINLY